MNEPLWVFGYGSLIWRPGFAFEDRRRASASGYRRWFCMTSIEHRGAPERPGLVLGLDPDPDAVAEGVAYRVAPENEAEVRDYLWKREMGTYGYHEMMIDVEVEGHGPAKALTYVIDHDHPQYIRLEPEAQARQIIGAHGVSGPNTEYLRQTVKGLAALGVPDPDIDALDRRVQALISQEQEGTSQ